MTKDSFPQPILKKKLKWDHRSITPGFIASYTFSYNSSYPQITDLLNCLENCTRENTNTEYIPKYVPNQFTFYEYQNTFITGFGAQVRNDTIYQTTPSCAWGMKRDGTDIKEINLTPHPFILGGLNPSHFVYAHFLIDWFLFAQLLPTKLIKHSELAIVTYTHFEPQKILDIFGFQRQNISKVKQKGVIFVRKFIDLLPESCMTGNPYLYTLLREKIIKNLGIKNRNGVRKVVYNRAPKSGRYVTNILDVLELAQDKFEEPFMLIGNFETQKETFSFFAEIAVMISVHGSVFGNLVVSPDGLIVLDYQTHFRYKVFEYLVRERGGLYCIVADRSINQRDMKMSVKCHLIEKALDFIVAENHS